jgi:hypothetical protein
MIQYAAKTQKTPRFGNQPGKLTGRRCQRGRPTAPYAGLATRPERRQRVQTLR